MTGRLVLIHTIPPLIEVFNELARQLLPGIEVKHILDEPLLEIVRMRGRLADSDAERLKAHVDLAERIGAQAALVTCSTVSPLVERVRSSSGIWVEKIDEAMIAEAVKAGGVIGLLATNPTTLAPTRKLIEEQAQATGAEAQIVEHLVPNAFQLMLAEDGAGHDQWVVAAILELAPRVDRIILAQASMARVLGVLPELQRPVPILSSPHLALARIRLYLQKLEPKTV